MALASIDKSRLNLHRKGRTKWFHELIGRAVQKSPTADLKAEQWLSTIFYHKSIGRKVLHFIQVSLAEASVLCIIVNIFY